MRWGGLFFKYVVLFVGLVTGVLVINAALDLYFVYQENRRASIEVQREKAEAAAQRVESFVREIERQIGWVAYAQFAALPAEQRRFDYVRLQRQVPAITELVQLDRQGREQLRVSRLSMDAVGAGIDRSAEPAFVEAMANKVYFSPVYYRKESEPYLTMAVAHGTGRSGVTVAEINLKLILDVISQIKIGRDGYTYVVDRQGRLIAHPDMSLVLRGTDMSRLSQVAEALAPQGGSAAPEDTRNRSGISVLSAHAAIPALGWLVFVELPTREAQQPVIDAGLRTLALLVLGLIIAGLAGALLARRMVVPIRTLQAGAARMGSGELDHRLSIKTGDELEALADQFNRSAAALEESHATLEQRVVDRTRELTETLEQQTATAEILRVISQSPTDVQPVLDAVAKAAVRFCGAADVMIQMRDGDGLMTVVHEGPLPAPIGIRRLLDRSSAGGRAIIDARTIHLPDIPALDPVEFSTVMRLARENGVRAIVAAPLLRDGVAVGGIVLRKPEAGEFSPRQIELLETFAAQAVIAIENVRLFTELKESLEQQTATAEILHAISQSPTDVQPVLDVVAKAAVRFCGATDAIICIRDGESWTTTAHVGSLTASVGLRRALNRENSIGRSIVDGLTCQLPDIDALDPVEFAEARRMAAAHGFRAAVAAPLVRDGLAIGSVGLRKIEPGPFTPQQIALLETFAAQAVIAIENVRLFTELKESLDQQTATAEILRAISQSPTDVQPVLNVVAKAALQFCGATDAMIVLRDNDELVNAAHEGALGAVVGRRRPLDRTTVNSRAVLEARTIHIPDVELVDPADFPGAVEMSRGRGWRAAVGAPMLREGTAVGAITLRKTEPGAFSPRQIGLLETFAAQAVIAIENVRLFTELRDSLERLKAAQANLVQSEKMASLGQLTAGIAHEIKNPLNFVNNFAGLSVELLAEIKELAAPAFAQLDADKRAEIDETMALITSNLEKIAEHGRRADGIVKSMLSHSRGGTGDWQAADINVLVEEALNLAYHGARAQDKNFNITLERDLTPAAKPIEVVPQDVMRVFLNLIGNGFYATNKRRLAGTETGFKPLLRVSTRDFGEMVEIKVRDNGTGIPDEVRAKLFQPFFTTKPTGEGTGLGLSISYDIVTQQHGGALEVESEVGSFTEFTVRLPRNRRVVPAEEIR